MTLAVRNLLASALSLSLLAACSQNVPSMGTEQAEDAVPLVGASDTNPVVVEIYQSQGCSSCPPANANINRIAGDEGILALSFAVTYWDRLGWKDIFADEAYTERQWDYARTGARRSAQERVHAASDRQWRRADCGQRSCRAA